MAIFPGAVSTNADLFIAVNNLSTTLTDNPLLIGATTVNVFSTTGFPTVGTISIDAEIIHYTGLTATSFTGCTRGFDGTTAASHLFGVQVDHNVVAIHHNSLKDEIIAIETHLGINGANLVHITGTENITGAKTFTTRIIDSANSASAFYATSSFSGGTVGMIIENLSNTASSDARHVLSVAGSSAGDAFTVHTVEGITLWAQGLDNSDLDKYKISNSATLGTNDIFIITTSGNVGIGQSSPVTRFDVASTGATSAPANSGTTPATGTISRFKASSNAVLDIGSNSTTYAWLQSYDQTGMNTNYPLALNPNGGQILFANGTAALPAVASVSDTNTGMYYASADTIGFATGGVARWFINSSGALDSDFRITAGDGSAGIPTYSFTNDTDTGIYRSGTNELSITTGGTERVKYKNAGLEIRSGVIENLNGTAALPTYSFANDLDTGIFLEAANALAFSSNGVREWNITAGGDFTNVTATGHVYATNGTAALPTYAFTNDTDTGLYRASSNIVGIACNGVQQAAFATTSIFFNQPVTVNDGTASAPTYTFNNDPDNGLYRVGTNTIGVATNGLLAFQFGPATTSASVDQTMIINSGPVGTTTTMRSRSTANVTTGATQIATCDQYSCLVLVTGTNGTDSFGDLIFTADSVATPVVIASRNAGAPAARTYTQSTSELRVAMASGTYDITCLALNQRTGSF